MKKIVIQHYNKMGTVFVLVLSLFGFLACEDKTAPSVNFVVADPDGKTIAITVESTDADSFLWDYGDGKTSTESKDHSHTYDYGGEYTITVTATNEYGTGGDTETVTVGLSMMDMLAGTSAEGKTWVLDAASGASASKITADLDELWISLPVNPFASIAAGDDTKDLSDEYDNEFTFKSDGDSIKVSGVNGNLLAGLLYASVKQLPFKKANSSIGLSQVTKADIDGTFTLTEAGDFNLDVLNENYPTGQSVEEGKQTVNFKDVNYLAFESDGYAGFFGFLGYTNKVIINEIDASSMKVTLFLSTLNPSEKGNEGLLEDSLFELPSIAITVAMKVKE